MSCRSVRDWLHRDVLSLDEAQRLRLDDHLAICEACRGDRMRMRVLHDVGTSMSVPAENAREYTRAIARALMEGAPRRAPVERTPRRWAYVFVGAATVTIAVIVAIVIRDRPAQSPAIVRAPTPSPSPSVPRVASPVPPTRTPSPSPVIEAGDEFVVEEGALRTADQVISSGVVPVDLPLIAPSVTRARVAGSRVVIAASSQVRWQPSSHALLLDRGSLAIDAAPSRPVQVRTASFAVVLDDAAATIDATGVRVRRGTARVTDRDGKVTHVATSWTRSTTMTAHARTTAELLGDARGQFAAKRYTDAERTLAAVLARTIGLEDEITARVLLADVAQAAGKLDLATTRYTEVATSFADAPAGESALYAAARLELRRARTVQAKALLSRYLARYPAGRFADDARRQLASIP